MAYLLNNLRTHARARGKDFTITPEQWEAFCLRTGYHLNHGREAGGLTVDRRDESRGYNADNIQVLTNRENAAKRYVPYFQNQYAGTVVPQAPGEADF